MDKVDNIKPDYSTFGGVLDLLQKFSEVNELVNDFGTRILANDLSRARSGDHNLPILFLFRRLLEIQDSITVLIRYGKSVAIKQLLRSTLENHFYLEYIASEQAGLRGLCFVYKKIQNKIKLYEKLDPGSKLHKDFSKLFEGSEMVEDYPFPEKGEYKSHRENLISLLRSDQYKEVRDAEKDLKKKRINNPPWYRLADNNLTNIRDLSRFIGKESLYEVFYKTGSNSIHGQDVWDGKFVANESGSFDVFDIRTPFEIQQLVQQNCTLTLIAYRSYIAHRIPEFAGEFQNWYVTRYRDLYLKLSEKEYIKINLDQNRY